MMKVKLDKTKMEHFDASKYVKFVPTFKEKDVDNYFLLFEKVAKDLNWPLKKYTILFRMLSEIMPVRHKLLCL